MPEIYLSQVTKYFEDNLVLDQIDFILEDNEFTVFIGPSGCGKSTLLRVIAGLDSVSSGKIFFDQKLVTMVSPKERNLAMVFQDYALYPHMNVYDNMAFALKIMPLDKTEISSRIHAIADMLELKDLLTRKPKDLSGGQRQRVAMGRALVRQTPILLCDEPLSNLDTQLRTMMRSELVFLKQNFKKNMIYVTHDQTEAMTLADRIIILNQGKIQQNGSPKELYEQPANQFVAQFIGTPAMNILKATIDQSDYSVYGQGFRIQLDAQLCHDLITFNSEHIHVGIRPHDLEITDTQQATYFEGVLSSSEYLGSETHFVLDCYGQRLCFNNGKNDCILIVKDHIWLTVDPNKLHFFDPVTQKRIGSR